MKKLLDGKVVVVTGSTRGIGQAIAEGCGRSGASVVVSSRTVAGVAACVDELSREGITARGFVADVSSPDDVRGLFDASLKAFGKIDVWVNNAGISGGYRIIQAMSPEEIREVLGINLLGTFYACRVVIPYFLSKGGGVIINLSGRGGRLASSPYQAPYAASKAAVTSLTRSLAAENKGKPISINCLFPGMVETDLYKDVLTCPETETKIGIMPVLLKAFATPMERVQKIAVKMCAVKPGSITGKSYSAERPERYWRALKCTPDFMKAMKKRH
jgi:NAD(P)-dependent dehydrogenase (short-subunit alcohol dehydrogenase family)